MSTCFYFVLCPLELQWVSYWVCKTCCYIVDSFLLSPAPVWWVACNYSFVVLSIVPSYLSVPQDVQRQVFLYLLNVFFFLHESWYILNACKMTKDLQICEKERIKNSVYRISLYASSAWICPQLDKIIYAGLTHTCSYPYFLDCRRRLIENTFS